MAIRQRPSRPRNTLVAIDSFSIGVPSDIVPMKRHLDVKSAMPPRFEYVRFDLLDSAPQGKDVHEETLDFLFTASKAVWLGYKNGIILIEAQHCLQV